MKTGDLVRISLPAIDTPTQPNYYLRSVQDKTGLIIGFPVEQERFHPYYRLWNVMIDGDVKMVQGMNLVVISEAR
jgi:hypothetical protein